MRTTDLVLTSQGVLSGFGVGAGAFTLGLASSASGISGVAGLELAGPLQHAGIVRNFGVREYLGPRGTRNFDRTTALVIAATQMVLDGRVVDANIPRGELGLVIGSSVGSLRSIVDFTREGLSAQRPYLVNPARFPNTVMNCAAGQGGIWHGLEGVNATISDGSHSAWRALEYAGVVMARGYAEYLLVGAAEELCPQTAWSHARSLELEGAADVAIGEGCAMFMIESRETAVAAGVPILACLRALELGVCARAPGMDAAEHGAAVAAWIRGVIEAAHVEPREIWAWSEAGPGRGRCSELEERAVLAALGGRAPERRLCIAERIGDTLSASGAMQVAALLALFASEPDARNRHGICTSVTEEGAVACLVMSRF